MSIVTDQAAGIGVTAIPTPIDDQASDNWFLWFPFAAGIVFGDSTGFNSNALTRFDFDSKAMRKVDDGDTAVVVLQNNSSAHAMEFYLSFRMLVKLHG